jgi:NADH dehydrogenase FAD-containing subunit
MKVIILGGGFAGVRCAQDLIMNKGFDLTLIDRKDYFEISFARVCKIFCVNGFSLLQMSI